MIKAPYNFVPLNDKVFLPDWADFISHDVPFERGVSGTINIALTAQSPIFVRNGGASTARSVTHKFSQTEDGHQFIPGSTLKGAIRSILEVLSYGKLSRVNDYRYAVRDLSRGSDYSRDVVANSGLIKMGWLRSYVGPDGKEKHLIRTSKEEDYAADNQNQRGGRYNSLPNRISFDDISTILGTDYAPRERYAVDKYTKLISNNQQFDERDFQNFRITSANHQRVIVLTGSFSRNKNKEFLFHDPWQVDHTLHQDLEVSEKQVVDFLGAYENDHAERDGSSWYFWKKYFTKGAFIPVFFLTDDNGEVLHFGLTQLYKKPFKYSIKDLINRLDNGRHTTELPDLADCLFGYISDKPNAINLKGRVQFGHAKAKPETVRPFERPIAKLLGTPKASYYPLYLEQDLNDDGSLRTNYTSYNHENARPKGRKRYPVHRSYIQGNDNGNEDMLTKFIPLESGAVFNGQVRFHNLLPVELGGLLSALTFHQNADNCFHQIGMGKPLGLGKCKIAIKLTVSRLAKSLVTETHYERHEQLRKMTSSDYMALFEEQMKAHTANWLQDKPIKELINMAKEQEPSLQSLRYMDLDGYMAFKGKNGAIKMGLPNYTETVGNNGLINMSSLPLSSSNIDSDISFDIPTIKNQLIKAFNHDT